MSTNCLVLWCVQMDRLSLVVTSELKYTEKYNYNKERKTRRPYCQFFITKDTTTLQEDTIAYMKSTCISKNISINILLNLYFTSRFTTLGDSLHHPLLSSLESILLENPVVPS